VRGDDNLNFEFPEIRANHSYPVLKKFRPRSYLIIFNLHGAVSYRDRGVGRTVNTPGLSFPDAYKRQQFSGVIDHSLFSIHLLFMLLFKLMFKRRS